MAHKLYHLIQFFQEVPKLKMPQLSIIGMLERLDKPNKSNPLRYMINGVRNKKARFCHILTPRFGSLAMQQKKHRWNNFYLFFLRLTLYFQVQFGLISCIIVLKEFLSVFNREAEKRKLTFHGNSCKEEKNVSSITRIFRFELPLKKLSWLDEYQPEKNYILRKKKQFKFARC